MNRYADKSLKKLLSLKYFQILCLKSYCRLLFLIFGEIIFI